MISLKNGFARLFVILLATATCALLPSPVIAAKKRVRVPKGVIQKGVSYSTAKLSRGTNSIVLTMINLDKVAQISYELTYSANGIAQGVSGSLTPSGQTSESRDLYLGTCSHGVCTPHANIRNAALTVVANLKSGGTYSKRYRVKL